MIKARPKDLPAPDPRETHVQLVERLKKGQPPARPMVERILTDPPRPKGDNHNV